jgi:replicative DNA helicase
MNRDQAKAIVKDKLEEYLAKKGINTKKNFSCLNPNHEDKNPSMAYHEETKRVKCFACGVSYDIFDLIGIDYGLTDNGAIFNKAYELYGITIDSDHKGAAPDERALDWNDTITAEPKTEKRVDFTAYYKKCADKLQQTSYLERRGISAETAAKYMIGYDPSYTRGTGGRTWQALIIPTGVNSYVARNTSENANKGDSYRNRGSSVLFNGKAINRIYETDKPVIVVEGEIDALSVIEAGGQAIGLGSTSNYRQLVKLLENRQEEPKAPLIIALDNDEEGEEMAAKLERELERLKVPFYRQDIYNGHKDANAALMSDRAAFVEQVQAVENIEETIKQKQKEEYEKNSAAYHIQDFINGIGESANTPAIRTGFSGLDSVLDGGLYEGLYIVGAISSLGKTTLVTQIADQIAEWERKDVIIFSLEMARTELMAKSISRLTLINSFINQTSTRNAKTVRGITAGSRYAHYSDAEIELIKQATNHYKSYANHIYIVEGVGDIGAAAVRDTVKKHIEYTGNTPVVVIDYVQILAPHDPRATDKQIIDKAVLELKRISRDFKTPVIGISSFNRMSYSQKVSMEAFKESGAIEYGSDCLIGLQLKGAGNKDFDVNEAKDKNPREVELIILKNRNGRTGSKITYEYYPMFNYFQEAQEE